MSLYWEELKRKGHQLKELLSFVYYLHWVFYLAAGTTLLKVLWSWSKSRLPESPFPWRLYYLLIPLCVIIGVLVQRNSRRRRAREYLNPNLEILEHEVTYVVDQEGRRARLRGRLKVRRLHDEKGYQLRLGWTGTGPLTVEAVVPGHAVIGPMADAYGARTLWRIEFGTPLAAGPETTIEFLATGLDPDRRARPMLMKHIDDAYKGLLSMRLFLPVDWRTNVLAEVYPHLRSDEVSERHNHVPDSLTGEVSWLVKKPKRLYRYKFSWNQPQA